jgi:hypothetical protein
VNQLIQLNNGDIQQATYDPTYAGVGQATKLPQIDADGLYRVLMIEWNGDSRANTPWYMDMWCIANSAGAGVVPFGLSGTGAGATNAYLGSGGG